MDIKSVFILEFNKILSEVSKLASFSAGATLIADILPSSDIITAREWQAETYEATQLLDRSDITIGGARDVREAVANAERGFVLLADDLLDVRSTIVAGRELRRKLEKVEGEFDTLAEIGKQIEPCKGLVSAVTKTIDEKGHVLDSASPLLGDIRSKQRVVYNRIQAKLQGVLSGSSAQYLQDGIVSLRNGRYVIPIKAEHKGRIKGIVHDHSGTGATLWIEPLNTVELNNQHRSLYLEEQDEINRVLRALSERVAEQGDEIVRVVERLAEVDCIFARAKYAMQTNAILPEFVPWRDMEQPKPPKHANERKDWTPTRTLHPGSTVWIKGARHPLLDPLEVVPTDIMLEDDIFTVLITGPNTGGKTVSLKNVGLMVLMAQSGLHLPAEEARLTVFEDVFADIGDEQSIEQSLSTFSAHISNVIRILEQVDDRSLVIFDELGSGTDPAEGAGLAIAIINYMREKGVTAFIATHYPELKMYATEQEGATNASMVFDVDSLAPTYEMTIGIPGRSNALAIARRLGLDDTILDDAMRTIGTESKRTEDLLEEIQSLREKIESQEAGARLSLQRQKQAQAKVEDRLESIDDERDAILTQARADVTAEFEGLRAEIRQLRRKLRDSASQTAVKKINKELDDLEAAQPEETPAKKKPRKNTNMGNLRVGDTVMVKTFNRKGEIVELNKNDVHVTIGQLQMRVKRNEIEFLSREKEEDSDLGGVKIPATPHVDLELDIRGKRIDEGIELLEGYLDRAMLAGVPYARIIHGKGTGKLRQAVRQRLTQHKGVVSWEVGRTGEGDTGVTVAKFEQL